MQNLTYEDKLLIEKHPYYECGFMNEEELREELKKWSRLAIIDWLKWNDRNGIYDDEQCMDELGFIMTYEQGVEIMVSQIIQ
jgi:hypothetical protein